MVIAFALLFPTFWTIMNAVMFGNEPTPMFGGVGTIDFMVPAFSFLVLLVTGLSSLPIELARNIESKAIKRYSFTPITKMEYIIALIMGNFATSVISLVVLFGVAIFGYDIQYPDLPRTIIYIIVIFALAIAVSSFGMFLASIIKGFQSTLSVALLLYFVFALHDRLFSSFTGLTGSFLQNSGIPALRSYGKTFTGYLAWSGYRDN